MHIQFSVSHSHPKYLDFCSCYICVSPIPNSHLGIFHLLTTMHYVLLQLIVLSYHFLLLHYLGGPLDFSFMFTINNVIFVRFRKWVVPITYQHNFVCR